jgi:hypothetical protein
MVVIAIVVVVVDFVTMWMMLSKHDPRSLHVRIRLQ